MNSVKLMRSVEATSPEVIVRNLHDIDTVQSKFDAFLSSGFIKHRLEAAIWYVDHYLDSPINNGAAHISSGENIDAARSAILSELFARFTRYAAYERLFALSIRGSRRGDASALSGQIDSKVNLQTSIADYQSLFADASQEVQFSALDALLYDARALLQDMDELTPGWIDKNKQVLCGVLAEHKVLQAVKTSDILWARYASTIQDQIEQTDIVVASRTANSLKNVSLQVKGRLSKRAQFEVTPINDASFIIQVPMFDIGQSMSLPKEDQDNLVQTIQTAFYSAL